MNWKHMLVTLSVALNVGLVVYLAMDATDNAVDFPFPKSFAQNRSVSTGGYSATTAEVSSSRQALYIVDNREKRLNVYAPTARSGGGLKPLATLDLKSNEAFGADLAGDVVLIPGRISSTTEAVYVIDTAGRRVLVVASSGKKLEGVGAIDLGKDFQPAP